MAEIKRYKVDEPWLKTECGLGEAPFWEKSTNTLRFFDIVKKQMHRVDLNVGPSSLRTVQLELSVGTTADIDGEGHEDEFVFGGKSGYGVMNKTTGKWRYIKKMWDQKGGEKEIAAKEHRMRSNDGAVSGKGSFFVGTMNDPEVVDAPGPEGVLFRLDPDLSLHRVTEPVTIPNGISWSQDEKTVYFTDSPSGEIKQYPYDAATGSIDFSAGKTFFKCPHEGGVPDGHCQDAEGCFWVAMHGTWRVVRLDKSGNIIAEIELPTRCVTCPGICGEDLYITSAAEEEPEKYPESLKYAGATFKVHVGVKGVPLNKFKMEGKA